MDRASQQFLRYRQAVGVTYVALVAVAVAYLIVSVSVALLQRHRTRASRPPIGNRPSLQEILACHTEVNQLFADLNSAYFDLPGRLASTPVNLKVKSREVQQVWRARWRDVGHHCRFSELAGTGLGPGFDQLAATHADLEELDIGYASLMGRFRRQLARGVEDIRRNLAASRRALEDQQRRTEVPPASQTPTEIARPPAGHAADSDGPEAGHVLEGDFTQ